MCNWVRQNRKGEKMDKEVGDEVGNEGSAGCGG